MLFLHRTEYLFNFDQPFEIHDDVEVLKRMGLACGLDSGHTPPEQIPRLKQFLPAALRDYVDRKLKFDYLLMQPEEFFIFTLLKKSLKESSTLDRKVLDQFKLREWLWTRMFVLF